MTDELRRFNAESELLDTILNTPCRFWTCPVCVRPRVEWNGDVATCVECRRTNKDPKPKAWRSIAVWPDTIRVGHIVGKNESDDTHSSRAEAEAVCGLLRKHGFGGDGKVFPVSTRVEPVWN